MSTSRNVLVILCDQLRTDFLSLYGCGAVPTPNLDRLAGNGVVFDRAITACAVCAPARASMLTGLFPDQHGVKTNYSAFNDGLDFIAARMNALGYRTGAFGKLHHNPARDVKGFTTAFQMEEGRLGEDEPYLQWLRERHPDVTDCWNNAYAPETLHCRLPAEEHYEAWIADRAIAWLASGPTEQPFFGWISFQGPHGPFNPPREMAGCCREELLPRAKPPEVRGMPKQQALRQVLDAKMVPPPVDPVRDNHAIRVAYGEMIAFIDLQIGRILAALAAQGRLANTTILFTADHGDLLGDHGMWGKGNSGLDACLGIPLVIAHHPAVKPNTRSAALANNLDIPGTVLAVAGDDRGIGLSRSLIDLAQPAPANPRSVNFSEYGNLTRIVEDHAFRYVYYPLTGEGELFDLRETDLRVATDGDESLLRKEREMLKYLVDFELVMRGALAPGRYVVPPMGERLRQFHPGCSVRSAPAQYPPEVREKLLAAGCDPDYAVATPAP